MRAIADRVIPTNTQSHCYGLTFKIFSADIRTVKCDLSVCFSSLGDLLFDIQADFLNTSPLSVFASGTSLGIFPIDAN